MDMENATIKIGRFAFKILSAKSNTRKGLIIDILEYTDFKRYFIGYDPGVILRHHVPEEYYNSKNVYLFDGANTYLLDNSKIIYSSYNDDTAIVKNNMGDIIAIACYYPNDGITNDRISILFKDTYGNTCASPFVIEVNGDNISTYINTQKRGLVTQHIDTGYINMLKDTSSKTKGSYAILHNEYGEPTVYASDELKYIVNTLNMMGITYLARNDNNVLWGFFEKPLYDSANKKYVSSMESTPLFDKNKRFDFIGKNEYCRIFDLTKLQGVKPYVNIGIDKASALITEAFELCQFKYVTKNQYGKLVAYVTYEEAITDDCGIAIGMPPRCTIYKIF